MRERGEVTPPELHQELPGAPAPPLVPVLWGTLWARLPLAVQHGQLPGMRRPEQRQQASAGQLKGEPPQALSDVPRAAAARGQGPREALRVAAWTRWGLRAELPTEEADEGPTVGRRQGRPSAAPRAAAAVPALPATRLTAEQSSE